MKKLSRLQPVSIIFLYTADDAEEYNRRPYNLVRGLLYLRPSIVALNMVHYIIIILLKALSSIDNAFICIPNDNCLKVYIRW